MLNCIIQRTNFRISSARKKKRGVPSEYEQSIWHLWVKQQRKSLMCLAIPGEASKIGYIRTIGGALRDWMTIRDAAACPDSMWSKSSGCGKG
jgi:hypothetical protein